MMRLYQREDCADSKPVREKLTELGITYIAVNVAKQREKRREVFEASGQYFIPVLVDGEVVIANDPPGIVRYLSERYGRT
ncbi:MAG TPA: glutaredoxin domain-containing protein [Syntrophobacteria bacterium]|nr:glutaredoxin domain-containing protein [Syntrophobacteria bacterium]